MSDQWQRAASEAAKRHLAAQHPVSDPAPTVETMDDVKKGPWFAAAYSGECSVCFNRIEEGDEIRADGQGSYECSECYPHDDETPVSKPCQHRFVWVDDDNGRSGSFCVRCEREEDPLPDVGLADDPAQQVPTPDEFMNPAPVASTPLITADEFMDPATPDTQLNVSGQPPARRDHLDRYIVVDPELGDFRRFKNGKPQGLTRATTFNKAAQNTTSLNAWGKRNVVMGASLRPDVLRRAHGMRHETDKDQLDRIVKELETAAGAKVSADEGTYLHEFTERMDAGLVRPEDAPEAYQADLIRYQEALEEHGLEPVPGLIERTTMIREFGGVVGTFDRIFYHRPSKTYMVGDLKTGKTMEYALEETETQIWTYAHGVNQNGVYDWHTDTWITPGAYGMRNGVRWDGRDLPALSVREDVGVIIHMPVQGPLRGDVYVLHADLVAGAEHAKLCYQIRSRGKRKVKLFEEPGVIDFSVIDPTPWEVLFSQADTNERASELWLRAKAEGITGVRLNELVALAQEAIRVKG